MRIVKNAHFSVRGTKRLLQTGPSAAWSFAGKFVEHATVTRFAVTSQYSFVR
jgi:hypothetical protein